MVTEKGRLGFPEHLRVSSFGLEIQGGRLRQDLNNKNGLRRNRALAAFFSGSGLCHLVTGNCQFSAASFRKLLNFPAKKKGAELAFYTGEWF